MKISIVITAYNVGNFIERAVKSVLSQTYKDIEVVIVEDCSTDNTKDIIEQLAKEDDRIKIVYHEENKGAGWGRRDGINACTGDYFITVDGDDWLDADFIESLVKRAEETGADVVSGGITCNKEGGYWEATCYGDVICEGEDWSDWEDIGGGGSQEIDITDAVKAYGLPTLVEQGFAKEGVTYVAHILNGDLSGKTIVLDKQGKLVDFFKSKYVLSPAGATIKFNYSLLKGHEGYNSDLRVVSGTLLLDYGKYEFYINIDLDVVKVSADMTTL